MSLYIRRRFKVVASANQNMSAPLISVGSDDSDERVDTETDLAEGLGSRIVVASGSIDEALPLGSGIITGRMLIIESDVDITFKLNGVGESSQSLKVPTTGGKARLAADIEFTSIHVSVPGTVDANIFYGVIGA